VGPGIFLKGLFWLENHSIYLLLTGIFLSGVVNYIRWHKRQRSIIRLKTHSSFVPTFDHRPKVSILIPAWNEAAHLAGCIDSILGLRYPNKELILCAGGADGTFQIAKKYAGSEAIVIEQLPSEGKQRSLKRCFDRSSGEIIFLTDADSRLDDHSFEETIQPLVNGKEDVCTGSRCPIPGQESNSLVLFQWINHLYQEAALPDYIDTLYGINAAIRRDALLKTGGFSAPVSIGTDLVLGRQLLSAGYPIYYMRYSRVQTDYMDKVSAYIRQLSRWYRNRLIFGIRYRHWSEVLSVLWAGGTSLFLLAAPLILALGSDFLRSLWMVLLFHSILNEARMVAVAARVEEGLPLRARQLSEVFLSIGASWAGMSRGLMESLSSGRGKRW
jgi:cellulose synthase/poly-beta-1,6-N-acetylglucosamine synthase-like glycosyltransferase